MLNGLMSRARDYWGELNSPAGQAEGNPADLLVTDLPSTTQYDILRAYYLNNRLYEWLAWAFDQATYDIGVQPIMNPAFRAVEFHATHLWPGDLDHAFQIEAESARIIESIKQIWAWGNWGATKQVAARRAALYGDLWIKVVQSDDLSQVYQQLLEPQYVTDFREDQHGRRFLRWVRLDTPKLRDPSEPRWQTDNRYWITEIWDKDGNVMLRWDNNRDGPDAEIEDLGPPTVEVAMKLPSRRDQVLILPDGSRVERLQFGFDFIPIVHAPFMDIGAKRGVGCFTLQLAKIDKLNEIATRLLNSMFPSIVWALTTNSVDKSGNPAPGLRIDGRTVRASPDQVQLMTVGGQQLWSIPGNGKLDSLVPNTPLAAQTELLSRYQQELELDLPELAYSRMTQQRTELSGKAIRLLLSGAIDREIEARGNLYPALIRSHEMALTIGSLPGGPFQNIGTFESGSFTHTFKSIPVLAPAPEELLDQETIKVANANGKKLAGWDMQTIFKEYGYTDAEIQQIIARKDVEAAAAAEQFAGALAGPDAGAAGNDNGNPFGA